MAHCVLAPRFTCPPSWTTRGLNGGRLRPSKFLRRKLVRLEVAVAFVLLATAVSSAQDAAGQAEAPTFRLVIHGGAGGIRPETLSEERQAEYEAKLTEALRAGYEILAGGGTSLDAIVAAITIMEESPLFNAGRGAVLTNTGVAELDASIMDGATRNAGAVASVKRVKSPILLAQRVMDESPHVMLIGEGAEAFAEEQGLEMVENEYFRTSQRLEQFERYRQRLEEGSSSEQGKLRRSLEVSPIPGTAPDDAVTSNADPDIVAGEKHGTVGAVALDQHGNLAAGTSTGGIAFKRWGRVGDSPIIGAGTWADNETCAISSTGEGEYFIRGAVAHDISAMMRYAGLSLREAAAAVIHGTLTNMGGTGGVIGIDREGNYAMAFNTAGMFRGTIDADGRVDVKMFGQ